jgi:hypothetical protein
LIAKTWLLLTTVLFLSGNAWAQAEESEKEVAVVEVGAAASQSLKGGGFSGGPTVAVEVTPIENRLELETGVTSLLTAHSTEWECRFSIQEALDVVPQSGIHGRRWPGVDSHE